MTEKERFIEKMKKELERLLIESNEISKIVSKAKDSLYRKRH